jgi:hypothetical protein
MRVNVCMCFCTFVDMRVCICIHVCCVYVRMSPGSKSQAHIDRQAEKMQQKSVAGKLKKFARAC